LTHYQVYAQEQIDRLVELFLSAAERDRLDPILGTCVAMYKQQLDEGGQVNFKGKAKAFQSHVRVSFLDSSPHQCRVGEAFNLL
jgi:uncharacterized protein YciU (UPF0263 family)